MVGRKDKYHMPSTIIHEDQKKIIDNIDKAIVAMQQQESPKELAGKAFPGD